MRLTLCLQDQNRIQSSRGSSETDVNNFKDGHQISVRTDRQHVSHPRDYFIDRIK